MTKLLDRRTMLRGAGGLAVGLPFLEAMLGRRAHAESAEVPKRVIFFFTSCGVNPATWWPTGGESSFAFGAATAPLEPFRSKILIPDGVSMETAKADSAGPNGHDRGTTHALTCRALVPGPSGVGNFGHLWDGHAGGPSLDQVLAARFRGQTAFGSLAFGVKAEGAPMPLVSRISYDSGGRPVLPMHTPGQAFDHIFAPLAGGQTEKRARYDRRKLVLDAIRGEAGALNRDLSAGDQAKLDRHLNAVGQVERELDELMQASCTVPERHDSTQVQHMGHLQMDLMVHAMSCDLTRVATLQWGTGQSGIRHDFLGHLDGHHAVSHKSVSEVPSWAPHKTYGGISTEIDHWYATQFAALLGKLDSVVEADGKTLLDHTVVLWINEQEFGIGNRHSWDRMPTIVAGGTHYFRSGRRVNVNASHGELLVDVMHALGQTDTTFGDPAYCRGPIPGLT